MSVDSLSQPKTSPKTRPRRTINRLALALLALAIALFAQKAFGQENIWDGLIFYLIAAVLFVWAVNPKSKTQNPKWHFRGLFASLALVGPGKRQMAGVWGLLLALIVSLLSWRFFRQGSDLHTNAWWFYGISLLLFWGATLLLTKSPQKRSNIKYLIANLQSPATLTLIAILALAALLRLWNFGNLPFGVWYDEAEAGLQARLWLETVNARPAFYDPINISGQFLLLYSAAIRFISDSVQGIRFVSVLFGLGSVVAAYLFGKQIKGTAFGLIMAFFIAVMRWDINFSRIAMTGIDAPFFELLSLYFLARLLRFGRLRDAVFAGMTIGFGLSFYTAFRLYLFALLLFFLLSALIWPVWYSRRNDGRWWLKQGARFGAMALAAWLVFMPVTQYALDNPDSFSQRVATTSIINKRDDPNLGRALLNSTGKHLAMFNIAGDKNGRHNLPGEPMLDPVMGALMILGFGLAVWGIRQPYNLFFVLLFPMAMVGGIFSLDFEAPQSLRSIAVIPAVVYFCALPVSALYEEAKTSLNPLPKGLIYVPAGMLALYVLWFNAHTYFVRQADDFAVWNAFSTPETVTGQAMAELGPDFDFYLSPFLMNHPSVRFISPQTPQHIPLPLPDALPIRTAGARPVAIFTHPDDAWIHQEAARLYPNGQFEIVSLVDGGPPSVQIALLSPADIASVQGLALRYWAGREIGPNQVPAKALKVDSINEDWSSALPLTPPFLAEWEGILYAPVYGAYQLHLEAPGTASLKIDGTEVLSGTGQQEISWQLPKGNHHFKLEIISETGDGQVRLSWSPPGKNEEIIPRQAFYQAPVTNNGLLGEYYTNGQWQGSPTLMQIDPILDTYFHLIPLPRPYTVRWRGFLDVPATGIYGLGLRAVTDAQLYLDERLILDTQNPDQPMQGSLSLQAGLHPLEVKFLDDQDRSRIHLMWTPPGAERSQAIPSQNLWPPFGTGWQPSAPLALNQATFSGKPLNMLHLATFSEGLVEPRDITVGPQGRIYVADTGAKAIQVFAADGKLIDSWTDTPDGPFEEPLALVAGRNGNVHVLDSTRQWVYSFNEVGQPLDQLAGPEAFLYHPRGLALFEPEQGGATLAIANTGSGQVLLYDVNGTPLGSVGVAGSAPGQLNEPVDVIQDEFGAYFITEGANVSRWQRLDPFGKPLGVWPNPAPAAFDGSHVTWGPDGSIFMSNSAVGSLRRYSPEGELLDEWHSIGPVTFNRPVGIYFDASRSHLYVSDIASGEVFVFQVTEQP